jgi:hypothetical protein
LTFLRSVDVLLKASIKVRSTFQKVWALTQAYMRCKFANKEDFARFQFLWQLLDAMKGWN